MSARDYFAIVGLRRRGRPSFPSFVTDGPVKKIKFSPYFKNKQSSQNSRFLGKMSARDYFAIVGLRRRRSSVISLFRHRDGPVKKIKFSPYFKNKQSSQNSRFLGKMSARDYFAVVGLRHCRSSVISIFRHRDGPVKKIKFPQFFKNKQSFQNSRFLGKMSARDYFAVVRCRRRPSSVISLFRHRDGPVKKNQIFAVFQKQAIFPKFKIIRQNECTRFFCRRRSSVIRHFHLSSQGRTCEKNQIFAVFQKQAIFPKLKIFRQNECTRLFRHRRSSPSRSSVISLFRHRDGPVKKNNFSPFLKNKQSFQNSRFLGKMSARDYFAVVGLCHHRSSVISIFRHRDGPVKKIKFPQFFKNKQSFQNSRFLGKMSARDYFAVVGRRRRRSSVISLFRHRDGPVKKIKFSPFFKNKQSFQNSRLLGKMSARDFFDVGGRRSSVISLSPHRDGPVKKIKFSHSISKTSNLSKIKDF